MTDLAAPPIPGHPAQFSKPILAQLRLMLYAEADNAGHPLAVLDPFAGTGGIHKLAEEDRIATFGVELQPEWAAAHPDTIAGNVLALPRLVGHLGAAFDVLATSPCYGNRMADSHNAEERCSPCSATGRLVVDGVEQACEPCQGTGRRDHHRNTYTHSLRAGGAEPADTPDNAQVMQFGGRYREFHERAWRACDSVLRPGALVLLNVKNHIRVGRLQRVVEFHLNAWLLLGYSIEEARPVPTRGLADGANADVRVGAELIVALRKPT